MTSEFIEQLETMKETWHDIYRRRNAQVTHQQSTPSRAGDQQQRNPVARPQNYGHPFGPPRDYYGMNYNLPNSFPSQRPYNPYNHLGVPFRTPFAPPYRPNNQPYYNQSRTEYRGNPNTARPPLQITAGSANIVPMAPQQPGWTN